MKTWSAWRLFVLKRHSALPTDTDLNPRGYCYWDLKHSPGPGIFSPCDPQNPTESIRPIRIRCVGSPGAYRVLTYLAPAVQPRRTVSGSVLSAIIGMPLTFLVFIPMKLDYHAISCLIGHHDGCHMLPRLCGAWNPTTELIAPCGNPDSTATIFPFGHTAVQCGKFLNQRLEKQST